MPVTPLPENTRIEITIEPFALKATDGGELASSILGVWFTKFTPLYSNVTTLEIEAGSIVANIPPCILKLAIFEASRWADSLAIKICNDSSTDYYKQMKRRFVTLQAILSLISGTNGIGNVTRKVLGDFEIEFDHSSGDNNYINRLLGEINRLGPVIESGGCLGLDTSLRPQGMVKGSSDPYRPVISRSWYTPYQGESGFINSRYTPGYNQSSYYPDRWRKSNWNNGKKDE